MCQAKIHSSISRIPGVKNIEVYTASRLTHLPVPAFIKSFNTSFPHPMPWRISLLPYGVMPQLHNMLLTNKSPRASPLPDSARTKRRGKNGTPSAHGCASQPTSKASETPTPFYRYLITRSAQAALQLTTSLSTREVWSNTSAPWVRSLRPWGIHTRDSTQWAPSTFVWDNSFRPIRRKILPPEGYLPSLYPSSTEWTQHPKVAPQENKQSHTSPVSHSSSSSDPENTAPAVQTPSPPTSPSTTSSSL